MRRSLLIYTLVGLLTLGASMQALAQYGDDEKQSRFGLMLGVYRPSGSTLRNEGNSLWKTLGFTYSLKMDDLGRPKSYVSLERSSSDEGRFSAQLTSISCAIIRHQEPVENRGLYYGIGAGIYMAKEEIEMEIFVDPGEEHSGTKLGITFVGGYNMGDTWFGEIRYTRMGKLAEGVDFSGLSLYVGARQLF